MERDLLRDMTAHCFGGVDEPPVARFNLRPLFAVVVVAGAAEDQVDAVRARDRECLRILGGVLCGSDSRVIHLVAKLQIVQVVGFQDFAESRELHRVQCERPGVVDRERSDALADRPSDELRHVALP